MTTAPEIVVACAQLEPRLGDPDGNLERTCAAVNAAADLHAQVIVLPELASSGYAFADRDEAMAAAQPVDGPCVSAWARIAEARELVIVGGFCELAGSDAVHNSAVLIDASGVRAVYRKAHLWDRERLIFDAGDAAPPVVQTSVGRISVVICYDLEFPEWVRIPALAGAQLLCAPVNWPQATQPAGERAAEVLRVQADAGVNRMFIAACDRVGTERGVAWVGGSVIVDADGWPLAGGDASTEHRIISARCRLADADDKGVGGLSDIHADRRPELYDLTSDTVIRTPRQSSSREAHRPHPGPA